MLRRIASVVVIAAGFAGAMCTWTACSSGDDSPTQVPMAFGTLRGTVTDAKSGMGIQGATVTAINITASSAATLTTDADGKYSSGIAAGSTRTTVAKTGYQSFITNVAVAENRATTLDVKLQPTQ